MPALHVLEHRRGPLSHTQNNTAQDTPCWQRCLLCHAVRTAAQGTLPKTRIMSTSGSHISHLDAAHHVVMPPLQPQGHRPGHELHLSCSTPAPHAWLIPNCQHVQGLHQVSRLVTSLKAGDVWRPGCKAQLPPIIQFEYLQAAGAGVSCCRLPAADAWQTLLEADLRQTDMCAPAAAGRAWRQVKQSCRQCQF